jgi:enterochelin esterase-like enzyme
MRRIAFLTFALASAACLVFSQSTPPAKGAVQRIKVHGKSLEGNLEGDSPDREVSIYLPPGYHTDRSRRYPVLYLLHGYLLTDEYWTGKAISIPGVNVPSPNVPAAMDKLIALGNPMIIVMPNAYSVYAGSMYSSSLTTGDWESYIAEDLVSYLDSHYRTIPNRMSRGLAGHSMGGYGTIRIGMKRPDVFSSLYIMSACCLINNPLPLPSPATAKGDTKGGPLLLQVNLALAAAFSPNPRNPPRYLDEPEKDGKPQPLVVAKWAAASPLAMIDQYVTNLKKYHAIAAEVGLQDTLAAQNKQLDQMMTDFGIAHTFETYEGEHADRVPERIEGRILPFFSKNLSARPGKPRVSQ